MLGLVNAARSARPKMTRAETAMIPVSRREIASADGPLAVRRERLEVEPLELVLGGGDPGSLGEQRQQDRQDAVDVVEPVGRLAAVEDEHAADRDLHDDRDLGDSERVPEPDRGPAQVPGGPSPDARRAGSRPARRSR